MTMTKKCKYRIRIDFERCKACGLCLEYCPRGALRVSEQFNRKGQHPMEVGDASRCAGCNFCVLVCPDAAIEIDEIDENSEPDA